MPNYNSSGRGGRGGRGGGSGRGGRSGGRGGSSGGDTNTAEARFLPCREFTTTGNCSRTGHCTFGHIVTRHAEIKATTAVKNTHNNNSNSNHHRSNNNNNRYNSNNNNSSETTVGVSGIAVWEQPDQAIKLFSGSDDGHWRLWNSGAKFAKEFEHKMNGKVGTVNVLSNFLFCGFMGSHVSLPKSTVGMVHVWNLQQPSNPPLEFHQSRPYTPFAHSKQVTSFAQDNSGDVVYTGSRDATIHAWKFDSQSNEFALVRSFLGHVGEVTGLVCVKDILWSCSTDQSIRTWNTQSGVCQYCITESSNHGHSGAVTQLLTLQQNNEDFVLSCSLDGDVKAWNASNGTCMATIPHGTGITCMALVPSKLNVPVLLVGCESGKIMIRSVLQTGTTPAFTLLASLSSRYTCGHDRPVKTLVAGPAQTFYSGGDDGKLNVWQITDDLGL
uniref:C3H1-type domain-containing protein n=2 Tax=Eucampia antarctica TaxID=49252 RepID=A0A7S2RKC5_9STRA|mmetsp:Transcript_23411/g.22472  ORF Transcript_23411/g.22472 Transcript_23411/m.22472 type:complete len:441 (+) Transcript_23411:45-1367(+)